MPMTDAEIRAEYAAKPWYSKTGVAASDVFSSVGSGLSFGLTDAAAQALTGATDEQLAEMQRKRAVRSGLAGTAAKTAGMLVGGRGAVAAGKGALRAVRDAPAAVGLARTAGLGTALKYLTGTAGPGIVPRAAAKLPSLGTAAKAGGILALLGINAADNADSGVSPAIAPQQALRQSLAAGKAAPAVITPQDRMLDQLNTILGSGKATMADLKAVSAMMPQPTTKLLTPKDTVLATTAQASQAIYDGQIKDITARRASGDLDLAGAQAETSKATMEYINRNSGLLGNNLLTMAQAGMLQNADEGQ